MPKFDQVQIQQRQQMPDTPQRSVQTEVVASPVNIAVRPAENNMMRLAGALKLAQPLVESYVSDQRQEGARKRSLGEKDPEDLFGLQSKGWMEMDAAVHKTQDFAEIRAKYHTEFNKDGTTQADLDAWLHKQVADRMQGMPNQHYKDVYEQGMAEGFDALRSDFINYNSKRLVEQTEANVTQLIVDRTKATLDSGAAITTANVNVIRQHLSDHGINLGEGRFDQLLFEGMKRIAEEGHPEVLQFMKDDRPDPKDPTKMQAGIYYQPGMKEKVDEVEVNAMHRYTARKGAEMAYNEKVRARQVDSAMGDVMEIMAGGDVKGAYAKFDELRKSGLFHGEGAELVRWMGNMTKTSKEVETPQQLEAQSDMLAGVYTGKTTFSSIMSSNLTPAQKMAVSKELRTVQHENRTLATAQRANEIADNTPAIFKSMEFRSNMDFLEGFLKPSASQLDPMGVGTAFERQQAASARLEFTQRSYKVTDPTQLRDIAHDVATKYQKRMQDSAALAGKGAPGWLHYSSLPELRAAKDRGEVDLETYRRHSQYFKYKQSQ